MFNGYSQNSPLISQEKVKTQLTWSLTVKNLKSNNSKARETYTYMIKILQFSLLIKQS